ncbi:hypothetical protein MXB_1684 [Myxobolus squamalis]|nr:hypothetical protein MXB_1684 [Myxobolus squamalis]
MPASLKGT